MLESVAFGPRREMTVKINSLMWEGNRGYYGPATTMRFGGIVNYDQVREAFKPRYCQERELNSVEYDQGQSSKPSDLYLLLSFERISIIVAIHCHSLTVTKPNVD